MPISLKQAKKVCSKSEYALVEASRAAALRKLSPTAVKRLATQARKTLAMWRGLALKQKRDTTAGQMVTLFTDVVKRFATQKPSTPVVSSIADSHSGVPKGFRRRKSPTRQKKPAKQRGVRPPTAAVVPAEEQLNPFAAVGLERVLGHVSSRNRRAQTKRDIKTLRGRG